MALCKEPVEIDNDSRNSLGMSFTIDPDGA
jgi:hypothetical protein